jgi:hypothetical protein
VQTTLVWANDIHPSAAPAMSNPPGPEGVSVLDSGNVLITNTPNNALESFAPGGAAVVPFAAPLGGFNLPRQAVQTGADEIDVSDSFSLSVKRVRMSDGSSLGTLSLPLGVSWGIPRGIAVADDRSMTAVGDVGDGNAGNGTVKLFDSSHAYVSQITGLYRPEGVGFDHAGNIWVANTEAHEVREYTSAGAGVTNWNGTAALAAVGEPALGAVTGIAVDPSGNVWVADFTGSRVVGFSPDGSKVVQVLKTASGAADPLNSPVTLDFAADGDLYVATTAGDRVVHYDAVPVG